jgi:YVTN family beta-propeller protein
MRFFTLLIFILFISCQKSDISKNLDAQKGDIFIVNGGDNSITLINSETLEKKNQFFLESKENTFAHHITFNHDKSEFSIAFPEFDFALAHYNLHFVTALGNVGVFDSKTGKRKLFFGVPFANYNTVFSKKSDEIWTGLMSHSGKVNIYADLTGNLIKEIPVGPDPSELLIVNNGANAVIACGETSFLTVIDTEKKEIIKEIKIDPYPTNVWPGWAEDVVFVENAVRNSLNVVNISTLTVTDYIDFPFKPGMMVYNPLNQEIWICAGPSLNKVFIYKKESGKWEKINEIETENDPHQLAFFDNDSKAVIINQKSNSALIFDVNTRKQLKKIITGSRPNGIAVW